MKLPRKTKKLVFGERYNHSFQPRRTRRTVKIWRRYQRWIYGSEFDLEIDLEEACSMPATS